MNIGKETIVVKASGKKEVFDIEKLRASLENAGGTAEDVAATISHVAQSLHMGMSTEEIYKHSFELLKKVNKPLARSYSLRRALMELGPSGFPFEDFVAEVLKTQGFETATRQTVLGGCVPHEVDVVAWNKNKLIMAEAKFHNEVGTKSDLKVALYVKARIDDLKSSLFNYGRANRKLDEGWLITNTKFSSTAINYGTCQNLTMIGWNYPEKGNLKEMIEKGKLHPITCLTSLTTLEKKLLMESGVVLCSTIKADPTLLVSIIGPQVLSEEIINEIKEL